MRRKVESIHDALVLLGEQTVKRWTTLIVLAGIQGKPHELIVTALVRARMCELLAGHFDARERDAFFTTGLFSVVDALMEHRWRRSSSGCPSQTTSRARSCGASGSRERCCAGDRL